jgi:hypothetical protein
LLQATEAEKPARLTATTAATQSGFDEYDRHVNQAATYLKKSNEMLGRDYKRIEGVQEVSPLS